MKVIKDTKEIGTFAGGGKPHPYDSQKKYRCRGGVYLRPGIGVQGDGMFPPRGLIRQISSG